MLPPKRSTRSAHMTTLPEPTELTSEHIHKVDMEHLENTTPQLVHPQSSGIHFVLNTPQPGKKHWNIESDSASRKVRRKLSTAQRSALEKLASRGKSPSLEARRSLSVELGLDLKVISVWFQNKRRPTNKPPESTRADAYQKLEPQKADQRTRQILGSISANAVFTEAALGTSINIPEFSSATVSLKAFEGRGSKFPSICDFLPSSSPAPASEACHSETSLLEEAPDSRSQQNKRRSLEWACLNDKRMTKKARSSADETPQGLSSMPFPFAGIAQKNRRQRTDNTPRRPSQGTLVRENSILRDDNQPYASLMHSGSFDGYSYTEKDVALTLIQLMGQRSTNSPRKSI